MGKVSADTEKALRLNVINNLIDQNLLIQEAEKRDIKVSDNDIEFKYTETLKNWKAGGELQKSLKAQGYTEGNMKEMVRNQQLIQGLSDSLQSSNLQNEISKIQELLTELKEQANIKIN